MDSSSSCSFLGNGQNSIEANNRINFLKQQTATLLYTPHFYKFGMEKLYFVYNLEFIKQIYSGATEFFKAEVEKYVGVKVVAGLIVDYSMSIEKDLPMHLLNSDLVKSAILRKQIANSKVIHPALRP